MSRVKSFMLLESGERIIWEEHGQILYGMVNYAYDDDYMHEDYGSYSVRRNGQGKDCTVHPKNIRFDKMLAARKKTIERLESLMRSEDLND